MRIFTILLAMLGVFLSNWSFGDSQTIAGVTLAQVQENIRKGHYAEHVEFIELVHTVDINIGHAKTDSRIQSVYFYPTQEDVQNLGSYSISYNGVNEAIAINKAITINSDGSIETIDSADFREIDSNSYDVFSSEKQKIIPFSGLQSGGYTFLDYTISRDNSLNESDWFARYYPQVLVPREMYRVNIRWKDVANKPNFVNTSEMVQCDEGKNVISCYGKDIPKVLDDDFFYWQDEVSFIELSEYSDWSEVVKTAQSLFELSYERESGSIDNFISSYFNKNETLETKIFKAQKFVARDIQYLSRSEHGNAFTPHRTSETLKKKIGDCKDKSALLIDILSRIGLTPYPVLVSTTKEANIEYLLPSLFQFNHAIVCFFHDGNEFCIDPTDNYTPWNIFPKDVQGKFALNIQGEAKPRLLPIDLVTWDLEVETLIVFNEKAGQLEKQKRTYKNHAAASYKSYLSPFNEEERKEKLSDIYQKYVYKKNTPVISFSKVSNMGPVFVTETETYIDPLVSSNSDLDYRETVPWIKKSLQEYYIDNKYYGTSVSGSSVISTTTFDLSSLWKFTEYTANIHMEHKFGKLTRNSSFSDDLITVVTKVFIPSQKIVKEEIKEFNIFLDALINQLEVRVVGDLKEPRTSMD